MWFSRKKIFLWLGLTSLLLNQVASSNFAILSTPSEEMSSSDLKYIDEKYSTCNGIDIREITIAQAYKLFSANQLTSLQLTKCYLQRIAKMNPYLHAVIETNPFARYEAFKADIKRPFGHNRSPLHGIPVLVKDSIAVNSGMQTTAGSKALINHFPKDDADVVKALKKAGAIIIGKANLAEFSGIRGTRASSRGGLTESAYNKSTSAMGSSSGSAVGISANLAMVSLGAETRGSLIAPASVAGVFTLKPTLGVISSAGVIPISHNQDCVGPMARTIEDLKFTFFGMNPKYQSSQFTSEHTKKLRVGVMRHPYWNSTLAGNELLKDQLPHLEEILTLMKTSSFFEIIDPIVSPDWVWQGPVKQNKQGIILLHDFKYGINKYLKNNVIYIPSDTNTSDSKSRRIQNLQDLIQYYVEFPDDKSIGFFEAAENTDGIHNKTYLEVLKNSKLASREALDWGLATYNLDALLFPNPIDYGKVPKKTQGNVTHTFGYALAAVSGYPSLNVPAGIDQNGVPFGVTLVGLPNTEDRLFQVGYYMEKLNPARQPPQFFN